MITHIITSRPSQKLDELWRVSDGIRIARRQDCVIVIGESPNKADSRLFIDEDSARRYLREDICCKDLADRSIVEAVLIEERDLEGVIVSPDGAWDLNYSPHRMKN
jgi:hypothetical protein